MHDRGWNTHGHNECSDLLNEEQLIEGINKILDEEAELFRDQEPAILLSYRPLVA